MQRSSTSRAARNRQAVFLLHPGYRTAFAGDSAGQVGHDVRSRKNHPAAKPCRVAAGLGRVGRGGSRRGGGPGGRGRGGDENASPGRPRQDYANYYGLISHLDHNVGRILDSLKKTGQADNTIVVLATDHGMSKNSHGASGKNNAYEHTSRVQMVFSGGPVPKAHRMRWFTFTTFTRRSAARRVACAGRGRGAKIWPDLIRGKSGKSSRPPVHRLPWDQRTIRDDRWKLFLHAGAMIEWRCTI